MRLLRILGIATRLGLAYILLKNIPDFDIRFARSVRVSCEELGLVFIKLGQFLAARKFFSGAVQTELEKLWDNSRPLPFDVIKQIVEAAVGESIHTHFDSFHANPYASASIAQTHVAYRHGRKVMVKVRRPGVLDEVHKDMRIAKRLIALGALISVRFRCIRAVRVPEQIETWLLEEAVFRNEKQNTELFRAAYDTDRIVVPQVEFAAEDVLIEEFLEGIPCNKWDERFRQDGFNPQESVRNFLPVVFGPPFRGVPVPVHGDPHPANLIVMKEGRMGIVDFGLVRRIAKHDLDLLNDAVFAVYAQNTERTVEVLLRAGGHTFTNEKKRRAFEREVAMYIEECQHQPFDYWLIELGRILMRHGVPTLEVFTLISRFGVLGNKVAQMFFPGSSTLDLVGKEIRAGMQQQMFDRMKNIDLFPLLYELSLRAESAPRDAARFVQHPLETIAEMLETVFAPLRTKVV